VVPLIIKGDPVRLNQILTNLLSNAIKFTEKGTVKLEVTGAASENQDILIEFKIADSGIGIPAEKQAVIFDAFTQASSDTTRKYGGTGLGLAIVKNLVELQAGTISVSSQPDSGSTFTVHLPFEQVITGPQAPSSLTPAHALTQELTGISVLVAEDNPVNQLLVKRILEKVGCKIDIANNGMDAITKISTKRYDMVLMDVQMPEMDGYEATTHIRNKLSQPACHVPIIAMTAHAFGTDAIKCISAGMNDYISKPFQPEDLYGKIGKHLNNHGYGHEVKEHPENILKQSIDLSSMYMLENGSFLNELVSVYSKQTPELIEKLEDHLWRHDYEAMKTVCQRIRSFYGVLKLNVMDNVLQEIGVLLNAEDPELEYVRITALVNNIILLISAINEEVKRNLGQTGCAVVR
jgi:CheY-like chemotaxis protein